MNRFKITTIEKPPQLLGLHLVYLTIICVGLLLTEQAIADISDPMVNKIVPNSLKQDMQTIDNYYDQVRTQIPTAENPVGVMAGEDNGNPPISPIPPKENSVPDKMRGQEKPGAAPPAMTSRFGGDIPLNDGKDLSFQKFLPNERGAGRAGYRNGQRNPFATTNRLLEVRKGDKSGLQFRPATTESKIPKMKLRGIIHRIGKKQAALLEIEGTGTHVVREDDTVGLNEIGRNAVIRIKKINRLNLVVEVGSLGQVWIIR